ncbi:hypothetical protein G7Y89_g6823 [Cudoniella acicularis]|uniref:Gfd2/YDR514C-like C-terminal domain-containing protein n=1 Tax=Cudoniella acicularis TaxID=354080 RepID=A0A8H4RJR8_9HELO|nr:hypothetical protein G7Y89_g6823 [Cudoniella acicularis]
MSELNPETGETGRRTIREVCKLLSPNLELTEGCASEVPSLSELIKTAKRQSNLRVRLETSSAHNPLPPKDSLSRLRVILIPDIHPGHTLTESSPTQLESGVKFLVINVTYKNPTYNFDSVAAAGFCSFDTELLNNATFKHKQVFTTESLRLNAEKVFSKSNHGRSKTKFTRIVKHKYLFGESQVLTREDFLATLTHHASPEVPSRVILVGHNIQRELFTLSDMGIDLGKQFPSIEAIIDTESVASLEFLGNLSVPGGRFGLDAILRIFDIFTKKAYINDAGNAAHFIMKCLLLITIRNFEHNNSISSPAISSRIELLRSIATISVEEEMTKPPRDQLASLEAYTAECKQRKDEETAENNARKM